MWRFTVIELASWVILWIVHLIHFGVFTAKGSSMDLFFKSIQFSTYWIYLGMIPLTYITTIMFINFQIAREEEMKVTRTLKVMNVST